MTSTCLSLLDRLQRKSGDCAGSWERFIEIYSPLLFQWSNRLHVPTDHQADLVQNTLVKLLVSISSYRSDGQVGFRGWLFAVLRNCWIDMQRRERRQMRVGNGLEVPVEDEIPSIGEQEYRRYILFRVQHLILADFPPVTQLAFQRYVLEDLPAEQVARELGLTPNAVYLIRSRVLKRIREELAGLVSLR